jgi:serine/threonine protein kinase/tetratricopeptide (TPR) repeat protein
MSANRDREEEIFDAARELADDERAAYLAERCGPDADLRQRIEGMLAADADAGEFFKTRDAASPTVIPADASRSPSIEKAGDRIGRYKLLQQIGEGGCGVVYMAEQEEPVRRRVALKVIKLGMDTKQVIARFEAERQALALMDHPNIARVLDAGATETGRPYFVMELVRGTKITEFCDQKALPTQERLDLFLQVCSAVQHAHQKGIIHRDIKPSNILVTVVDGVPVPKVIDFGIAKATNNQPLTDKTVFTAFEQFIGTPAYMSPEQAELSGVDIDTRTDIYSLGVVLYELLTGGPPFDQKELLAAGLDEMRRIIRETEPPRPSNRLSTMAAAALTTTAHRRHTEPPRLIHSVRGDLDWIAMKCLEKDRARRYETANALAADIRRHLESEPVVARPPSRLYEFQKTVRRHKFGFAAAAAVILVLAIGVLVSTVQALRATRAKEETAETLKQVSAERDAKEQARKDAEAISTFLTEVFQSPDPTRDGRTITVVENLDRAAKRLETDLADQPGRRAKLQDTLANTYSSLSLWGEARGLREKVRDYYVATCGPEHPDTLTAKYNLAVSRGHENVPLMEEVLTLRRKVLGPEHPDTLRTMIAMAGIYSGNGREDEALKLAEQALALNRKVLGSEHPITFAAMLTLASCYAFDGPPDEAIKSIELFEEVLTHQRKVFGPKHPNTIMTMWNLGAGLHRAGRQTEGIQMKEESLKLRREVQGDEHGDTRWAIENLAKIYKVTGRGDKALSLFEAASATKPEDIFSAMRLAASQLWFGSNAGYATTVRRMLDWAKNATNTDDMERVAKLACLRPISDAPTREAALALARKAVELGRENQAGMPWYQMTLGMAEYRSGHDAEAVEALTRAQAAASALAEERFRELIRDTAGFYHAMSLSRQGKQAEARALFTATEAAMQPFPADEQKLPNEANHDDLILWLACKEAKAMLAQPDGAQKAK